MKPRILLASSSKYRQSLLKKLFNEVECLAPEIDERSIIESDPETLATKLAELKAQAALEKIKGRNTQSVLIIGSDQVAYCDEVFLHKPGSKENNCAQLAFCSGKTVTFYTAVSVLDSETQALKTRCDHTRVHFKTLSKDQIHSYVQREPAYDCAGGFKAEGLGITLFKEIESSDPNALIGLPLIQLCELLEEFGAQVI